MAYSDKVLDHYNNPRNVGSLPRNDPDVGTGVVGAPACGDVMKLQIRIVEKETLCARCSGTGKKIVCNQTLGHEKACQDIAGADADLRCEVCNGTGKIKQEVIDDAKFKTFGCGSAIAASSLATEWLKGMTADQAEQLRNKQIVDELSLPPIKIHCSVLAESAIKAALADYHRKKAERAAGVPHAADEAQAQEKKDA